MTPPLKLLIRDLGELVLIDDNYERVPARVADCTEIEVLDDDTTT